MLIPKLLSPQRFPSLSYIKASAFHFISPGDRNVQLRTRTTFFMSNFYLTQVTVIALF